MADNMKMVAGHRPVVSEKGAPPTWVPFSKMVPLSAEDLRQREIDEAAHAARADKPPQKTHEEIIAELLERVARLEASKS